MKFTHYGIAGLVLAGLGIGVPFSADSVSRVREPAPRAVERAPEPLRTVYVDTAGLLKLHPGWQALADMRATIASAQATAAARPQQSGAIVVADLEPVGPARPQAARRDLELASVQAAIEALHGLEKDKQQTLWIRLDSRRAQLAAEAEARVTAESAEIERMAAAAVRELEQKNAPQRLNAQLKLAATRVAARADKDGATGAAARLPQVQSVLERIDDASAGEQQQIRGVTMARIAAVRDAEMAELDRLMTNEETRRRTALSQSMVRMRSELLDSLKSEYVSAAKSSAEVGGARQAASVTSARRTDAGGAGLDALRTAAADMDARIREDVTRAVRELAADEGVSVVFERSAAAEDATARFAKLMSTRGGLLFGPVMVTGSS